MSSYQEILHVTEEPKRKPDPARVQMAHAVIFEQPGEAASINAPAFECEVMWCPADVSETAHMLEGQHQSIRDNGRLAEYPAIFNSCHSGTLKVAVDSLTLMHEGTGQVSMRVTPSTLFSVIVYANAIIIKTREGDSTLVQLSEVERVDAMLHGYFWPRAIGLSL